MMTETTLQVQGPPGSVDAHLSVDDRKAYYKHIGTLLRLCEHVDGNGAGPHFGALSDLLMLHGRALAAAQADTARLREPAQRWWLSKRPVAWSAAEHFANPTINTTTPAEKALATAVAESFDAARAAQAEAAG